MKFAVIEYATKTGQIWRPTPERPNYLGDPIKEIDPTSFACYTTALHGEHIPLTGLVGVTKVKKAVKRLTGSWPPGYSLSYLKQFDVLMIVHQLSDSHEMERLVHRVKRELPHIFVIGVPTQPFGILKDKLDAEPKQAAIFKSYMEACDVFLTVVKRTADWYQQQTKTPVMYMPQPYPYHYARQFAKARNQKQPTILIAGVTQRPDIKKGQLVAKELQKLFPEYELIIPKVPEYDYDETNLQGSRYRLLPFEQWRQHLITLANTTLVINTDYTQTRGRVQTDCAAVGTPSLGADSDGQSDLFPELASAPATAVADLVERGQQLLTDQHYYDQTVRNAHEKLKKYDYDAAAARLMALVKTYRHV